MLGCRTAMEMIPSTIRRVEDFAAVILVHSEHAAAQRALHLTPAAGPSRAMGAWAPQPPSAAWEVSGASVNSCLTPCMPPAPALLHPGATTAMR